MFDVAEAHSSKILIVDDDPTNLMLLKAILKHDGYTNITTLADPTQVTILYTKHRYDLIALDIHMPKMTGFDVMGALKARFPNDYLPIVVLTADEDDRVRDLALASGARDFIRKPFNRREVLLRSGNILETVLLQKKLQQYNENLEQTVSERTKQLKYSQVKLIECLGRAAEYKDNETGAHVLRISKMTGVVAKALGLSEKDIELVQQASPMHDIGKIGIPDRVLLKPGKLEGDEWTTMQTHSELGSNILCTDENDSDLLKVAAEIALTHHEKWDGSGYPGGLRGTEIPIYTRITTVCDVFDALTSRRPYKKPWPVQEAMRFLEDQSGTSFDPCVVNCFKKLEKEIMDIKQLYPDPPPETLEAPAQENLATGT